MRRILIILALILSLVATARAANKFWWASCLTGSSTCLDAIPSAGLTDGDGALVVYDDSGTYKFYPYRYEDSSSAAESSPNIVKPDDNAGNGRWLIANYVGASFSSSATLNPYITFDSTTASADYYIGTDQANTSFEIRQSATAGTDVKLEVDASGNVTAAGDVITTSQITGKVYVKSVSTSCTIGTDCDSTSLRLVYGGMLLVTASITVTLPDAAVGMSICIVVRDDNEALTIDSNANDSITLDGTKDTAGQYIINTVTASTGGGDFVCMVAVEADNWMVMGKSGTWTAE